MSYVKSRYLVFKYSLEDFNVDSDEAWREQAQLESLLIDSLPAQRFMGEDVLVYELIDDPETEEIDGRSVFNLTVELCVAPEGPLFEQVKEELLERLQIVFRDRLRIERVELQTEVVSVETVEVKL